ncbi:hypothetical protein [Bacillus swezeyi]|uniref:Lipoprotein n=1 Tax=Bacillus swezeyi TaxID=1925020 RepID=A0A5M8RJE5_9BACI|nr:hypothetical protein [Bacillus swezeyi]KAA6446986.1 hypothetical protein DX927_23360 [Bacillus swezeyi]KAA6471554.1 hypothetical protein DX928_23600 [Bacillus swezeyi]
MKFKVSFMLILSMLLLLTACSSNPSSDEANSRPKYLDDYDVHFKNTINKSTKLFSSFNQALDDFYTKKISTEQFKHTITKTIEDSTAFIQETESIKTDDALFEMHQHVLVFLNNQHQLFLDAVEMANEKDIDKKGLRDTYLSLKEEQVQLSSTWTQMLTSRETTAKK